MRKRGIRLNKISYKKIIYTQQQLSERIAELGKQITADYEGQEIVLLGVLKGSLFFCTDLARAIDYWLDRPKERLFMGAKYRESACKYSLSNCVKQFEQMLRLEASKGEMRYSKTA